KISGPMVVVKVGIIVVFGFAMIPHWNFANITAFPQASVFFRDERDITNSVGTQREPGCQYFIRFPFTIGNIHWVKYLNKYRR
ncbi:hypothetical protein ACSLOB_29735, partial [Escherichia coli]